MRRPFLGPWPLALALALTVALTLALALASTLALALTRALALTLVPSLGLGPSLVPGLSGLYRAPFPSTADSAALKARVAKDGRNGPNPSKQALTYSTENRRRNQPKSMRPCPHHHGFHGPEVSARAELSAGCGET